MSEKNPSAVLRTRGIARAVCAAVLTLAAVAPVVARDDINLHLSGVKVTYDPARPAGQRITRLTFTDGRPINARQSYRLVTLDFILTGGDGSTLARVARKVEDLKLVDLEALARYVKSRPQPLRAPTDARLIPLKP